MKSVKSLVLAPIGWHYRGSTRKVSGMVVSKRNGMGRAARVFALVCLLTGVGLTSLAFAKRAPPAATNSPNFNMSDALRQAGQYMTAIDTAVAEANSAQARLQDEGKMAKLEGSADALRQLERLVAMAQKAYQALQRAVAQNNGPNAEREFVKVNVAYQRILDIVARLKGSAGTTETSTIDGTPEIDLLRDADLPTSDPGEDIGLIDTLDVDTGRPPATTPIN